MTEASTETRSVTVERTLTHPPEKVWRALTQPHLMAEWLMKSDFQPVESHDFTFTADWGSVECRVLEVEPERRLVYTWEAYGLESTVTWTLTPTEAGTHLQMEQRGFRHDQRQAYQGARAGWQRFLSSLEQLLDRIE